MRPCDITQPGWYFYRLHRLESWTVIQVTRAEHAPHCDTLDLTLDRGWIWGPIPDPDEVRKLVEKAASADLLQTHLNHLKITNQSLTGRQCPVSDALTRDRFGNPHCRIYEQLNTPNRPTMKPSELLTLLKQEKTATEARYRGANEAYITELVDQSARYLRETFGIRIGDRIITTDHSTTYHFQLTRLDYRPSQDQVELVGVRILKSGKPSKAGEWHYCYLSAIENGTVTIKKSAG